MTDLDDLIAEARVASGFEDYADSGYTNDLLARLADALEAVLAYCALIPEPYYPDGRPESSTYRAGAHDTALEIVGRIESALGGSGRAES